MSFTSLLNKTIAVYGLVESGRDTYNQPVVVETLKGAVRGRIEPRGGSGRDSTELVNGPDLNPIISDYIAFTELAAGFILSERDTLTDADGAYEVLGVGTFDGRVNSHHLEVSLRKITA